MQFCPEPGCSVIVQRGRCPKHTRPDWQPYPGRIKGRRLQQLRQELFSVEPFCRLCLAAGRKRIATIRDHIRPLAEGGTNALANIQPLCQACSDRKSQQEAARGRR